MQTDRRTRDRIRLFFWALLTVVCLVAALVARQQQQQGLARKAQAAEERATRYTQNVLVSRLDADRVSRPIERSGYTELLKDVKRDLFTDGRLVRVRIFRPDGLLVFTTDDPSQIGKLTSEDQGVAAAIGGEVETGVESERFAPDTTTTPKQTDLLATYVPMRTTDKGRVYGVAEYDTDYGLLRSTSSKPWSQLEFAFGILAALCLAMTVLSFIWSRRPQEVSGFGPSRRDVRAAARDDKKVSEAKAEVTQLRERVKELEGQTKSASAQTAEVEKLRARVAELEQRPAQAAPAAPAYDPAELQALTARAAQFEDQARGSEARMGQLQARVTEMEAQLRMTTDQLRSANKRLEDAQSVPPEIQAKLRSSDEREQHLSTELQAAHAEAESLRKTLADAEAAHAEEIVAQQAQLDQARAQARIADDERKKFLAEAAKAPAAAEPTRDARVAELEEQLKKSEHERAMLRAGRPETVYEARNRELEEEIDGLKALLGEAETHVRSATAGKAGVDPSVIADLENRIAAAEARAEEAEKRLNAKSRTSRRSAKSAAGNGANGDGATNGDTIPNGDVAAAEEADGILAAAAAATDDADEPDEPPKPKVDGSELRSRLVRSTDARRRGISTPTSERS